MVDLEALERPKELRLGALRKLIQIQMKEKNEFGIYGSPETKEFTACYEPDGQDDLVEIQPLRSQRDIFTESFVYNWYAYMSWLRSWVRKSKEQQTYKEMHWFQLTRFTSITTSAIVAVVGTLSPVISILILFFIKNTLKRIFVLMGLTVAFAFGSKAVTDIKTSDLFSVTAV